MNIRHEKNTQLPVGSYRLICSNCQHVFINRHGNFLDATKDALRLFPYDDICTCNECNGHVVLESHFEDIKQKFTADYTYLDYMKEIGKL